jgi:hypothetical protein
MPHRTVSPDSIADRARALGAPFACSRTDGGPNAASVHVAGELDVDLAPGGGS